MLPYYFETLPLHPGPEPLESLVSYLIRISEENGFLHIRDLDAMIGQNADASTRYWTDHPRPLEALQKLTLCSGEVLLKTTFYHLGRKFGRLAGRIGSQNFLSGSVNTRSLRYCPMCLSEHAYYPLTWRFLAVTGCHLHACQILERCGHCGSTVPGYAKQWRIACCPKCNGDLRTCSAQPLSVEEHHQAITQFQELEFLLSPEPWEEDNDALPKMIGQTMAHLRQAKGLTLKMASHQSGLSLSNLKQLENCFLGPEIGVSFQCYSAYAAFLGVTLRNMFDLALRSELNPNKPAPLKSKIPLTEEELVETVQRAVAGLLASGRQVTGKSILGRMGIHYQGLTVFWLSSARQECNTKDEE